MLILIMYLHFLGYILPVIVSRHLISVEVLIACPQTSLLLNQVDEVTFQCIQLRFLAR